VLPCGYIVGRFATQGFSFHFFVLLFRVVTPSTHIDVWCNRFKRNTTCDLDSIDNQGTHLTPVPRTHEHC